MLNFQNIFTEMEVNWKIYVTLNNWICIVKNRQKIKR